MVAPLRRDTQAIGLLVDFSAGFATTGAGVVGIQLYVDRDRSPVGFPAQAQVFAIPDIVEARDIGAAAPASARHIIGAGVSVEVTGDQGRSISGRQVLASGSRARRTLVEIARLDRQAFDVMTFQGHPIER
ncbi:hypothetical protein D3C79_917580 [compost metagenome]